MNIFENIREIIIEVAISIGVEDINILNKNLINIFNKMVKQI